MEKGKKHEAFTKLGLSLLGTDYYGYEPTISIFELSLATCYHQSIIIKLR